MDTLTLLSDSTLFGIEIFDKDFYKLTLLFGLNIFVTLILARGIYYPFSQKKPQYLFTYILLSTVVFFLCVALKAFKFDAGVAIGLFALLGIMRFRTDAIPVKEMSYLFVFIGISMINAFSKKMSLYEIAFINLMAISIAFFMEILIFKKPVAKTIYSLEMNYGRIYNLKPENYEALVADISSQTGLKITQVKIGKINLKTQDADLKVYYKK